MTAPSFTPQDLSVYKKQLEDYLNRKNIDQSLILGFTNLLQSKLQSWIVGDFNRYFEQAQLGPNAEFTTIKYFEFLWTEIHYPIIKFFQAHHADYFNQNLQEFRRCQNEKATFKLKSVEVRKVNEAFLKVVTQFRLFYMALLKHFLTHFKNPLLPLKLLNQFDFVVPSAAIDSVNANIQANLIFLCHKCLLCLGDLSRHRAFNDVNYVLPCLSQKNFQKFRIYKAREQPKSQTPKDPQLVAECKSQAFSSYGPSINLYKQCIMLLPTLNEPYNHIGMIYNMVGDKVEACYWFLRSRFTRIPNYDLGLKNLESIMAKSWFQDQLGEAFKRNWQGDDIHHTSSIVLLNLIGYAYLPQRYRHGDILYGTETYTKVELSFFGYEFEKSHFASLISDNKEDLNHYAHSLLLLIMFNELLCENGSQKLFRLFKSYIRGFVNALNDYESADGLENVLIFLRLCMSYIKESKSFGKYVLRDDQLVISLSRALNELISRFDLYRPLHQDEKPTRSYFFTEDVLYKDFLPIKYQFKDFDDNALFTSGSVDALMGNDNETETEGAENVTKRALAVLLLWKKLATKSKAVEFGASSLTFEEAEHKPKEKENAEKTEKKKEKKKEKKPKEIKPKEIKPTEKKPTVLLKKDKTLEASSVPSPVSLPERKQVAHGTNPMGKIQDLEAVILSHTNGLHTELSGESEDKQEASMDKLVDNLLDEKNENTSLKMEASPAPSSGSSIPLAQPAQVSEPVFPGQGPFQHLPPQPMHPQQYFSPFNGPPNGPHNSGQQGMVLPFPPPHPGFVPGQVPGQLPGQGPVQFPGQMPNGVYDQNAYYQMGVSYGYGYPPPQQ